MNQTQLLHRSTLRRDTLAFLRSIDIPDFFGWGGTCLQLFGLPMPSDFVVNLTNRDAVAVAYRNAILDPTGGGLTPVAAHDFDRLYDQAQIPLDAQLTAVVLIRLAALRLTYPGPETK